MNHDSRCEIYMSIKVELDRSIIIDKLYYMGIDMGYSLDYIQFMNKMRGYE